MTSKVVLRIKGDLPPPTTERERIILYVKHLPGQHDQSSHGRGGGRGGGGAGGSAKPVAAGSGTLGHSVIGGVAGTAIDVYYTRTTKVDAVDSPLDDPKTAKVISKFEDRVADDHEQEHVLILNEDGTKSTGSGDKETVDASAAKPGAHITHNHPTPEAGFSTMDVNAAVTLDAKSIRAVSRGDDGTTYAYEVRRPKSGWPPDSVKKGSFVQEHYNNEISWQINNEWAMLLGRDKSPDFSSKAYAKIRKKQEKVYKKHGVGFSYTVTPPRPRPVSRKSGLPISTGPADFDDDDFPILETVPKFVPGKPGLLDDRGMQLPGKRQTPDDEPPPEPPVIPGKEDE